MRSGAYLAVWRCTELAGGFGMPSALRLSVASKKAFSAVMASVAREDPRPAADRGGRAAGDPILSGERPRRLGIGADAAAPAVAGGLVDFGTRVRFRIRWRVRPIYRSAPVPGKQSVHRALGRSDRSGSEPDRRAWHRARATEGPDEDVSAELERLGWRARARGGLAAAAAFSSGRPC